MFKTAAKVVNANKAFIPKMKTASIFKKAASAARRTFNTASIKNDVLVRGTSATRSRMHKIAQTRVGQKTGSTIRKTGRILGGATRWAMPGLLSVGAIGITLTGIMNGINNASRDYVLERYMADQRFSRDILLQSRVGLSMGTNKMNRMGSTMGLSNALSKTRHGARY